MDEILFAVIGRKQVALEEAYTERRRLLEILQQVVSGRLPRKRVTVDPATGQVEIKPE